MFRQGAGPGSNKKTRRKGRATQTDGQIDRDSRIITKGKIKNKKGPSRNWGLGLDLVKTQIIKEANMNMKSKSKCDIKSNYNIMKYMRPIELKGEDLHEVDTRQDH